MEEFEIQNNEPQPFVQLTNAQTESNKKKPYKFLTQSGSFWFLTVFGMFFIVFIFTFQVLLTPIKVVGTSMQPTINISVDDENDKIKGDIVYYSEPKKLETNDIIIVSNTKSNTDDKYINTSDDVSFLIKRIIAVGGQTVKFYVTRQVLADKTENRVLYYDIKVFDQNGNDINLDQSYLNQPMHFTYAEIDAYSENHKVFKQIFYPLKFAKVGSSTTYHVQENCYFIMGDNRNASGDSRIFGEVEKSDIVGKVQLIVPYGKSIFSAIWSSLFGANIFYNTKFCI